MVKKMDILKGFGPLCYSPSDGMLYGMTGLGNTAIVRISGLAKPASEVKVLPNATVATSSTENKTTVKPAGPSIQPVQIKPTAEVKASIPQVIQLPQPQIQTVQTLESVFASLNLTKFLPKFQDEEIELSQLSKLSEKQLEAWIPPFGSRLRLQEWISNKQKQPSVPRQHEVEQKSLIVGRYQVYMFC